MTAAADGQAGENVAVVLTPPGVAAIAVVRLSGPLNDVFATTYLSRPPKAGRCVHADIRVAQVGTPTFAPPSPQVGVTTCATRTHATCTEIAATLDDAVVVRTAAGHLDLNLHGGIWVVASVLRLAEAFGYRLNDWKAAPEAMDAEDAIERQMLLDLPQALSPTILRMLAAQPAAWRAMLATDDREAMRRALADTTLATALAVPSVAIVGPPNVGKSTLANALAGSERSITADAPGTTRDWVGGLADIDGLIIRLIDTPGLRATDDAIESAAIERSSETVTAAACVIVAFDGSRPLDDSERRVLVRHAAASAVVVRTKCDRPSLAEWDDAIDVCAITGDGLPALRSAVLQRIGVRDLDAADARCWTGKQHYKLRRLVEQPPASI